MNLNEYLIQTNSDDVKNWLTKRLPQEFKEREEDIAEIEHIIDYLNSDQSPKKLFKMSYKDVLHNSKKWLLWSKKRGEKIIETEQDTEVVYLFKDGMKLSKLLGEAAFKREGYLMSHCVGSYFGKDTEVYSLRDSNDEPHCTFEVNSNNVQQIKGKGNGDIHPKYIKHVVELLEKFFNLPVRDSELERLGYSIPPEGMFEYLDKYFKGYKFLTFNGKKYLYNKSNIVRK